MAEIINKYETIFVLDAALEEEKITALTEKFKALIEKNGKVESIDDWGNKRLAYPIEFINEGHYVLINFEAGVDFPAELERVYNITDTIMRSMTVSKEEK